VTVFDDYGIHKYMNIKIGIIGAGNMGAAIYKGLLNVVSSNNIFVCDKSVEKLNSVKAVVNKSGGSRGVRGKEVVRGKSEVNFTSDPNDLVKMVDVVIFAVKPQSFRELCEMISVKFNNKLVVSIMAGISIASIKKMTGAKAVVRSMPNLPVQVFKGLTGWMPSRHVSAAQKKVVKKIFGSFGEEVELKNESQIDAVTALSGSGPAYFFYLCELMSRKAVKMGFSHKDAEVFARRTMIGAAHLLEQDLRNAEVLRKSVTSKGGTTEAALKTMKKNRFESNFNKAVDAAYKRSIQLNSSKK